MVSAYTPNCQKSSYRLRESQILLDIEFHYFKWNIIITLCTLRTNSDQLSVISCGIGQNYSSCYDIVTLLCG